MREDHVSTINNTPHTIDQGDVNVAQHIAEQAFIRFVTSTVRGISGIRGLDVEQRNLLVRTYLADFGGALRPLARMLNCTDGAADVLPEQLREALDWAR